MKYITRTFSTTEIKAVKIGVNEKGEILTEPLQPIKVDGELSDVELRKAVTKVYGKNIVFQVVGTVVTNKVYRMLVEDFIKHGEQVKEPEASKEKKD